MSAAFEAMSPDERLGAAGFVLAIARWHSVSATSISPYTRAIDAEIRAVEDWDRAIEYRTGYRRGVRDSQRSARIVCRTCCPFCGWRGPRK